MAQGDHTRTKGGFCTGKVRFFREQANLLRLTMVGVAA
jgi:hypothetical protein